MAYESAELLEQRQMLAGVIAAESTFDIGQFVSNIREQAGEDPALGLADNTLNVVGFSYAVSQRDESDPFGTYSYADGARGSARLWWDTAQTPDPGLEFVASRADRPQEIASISKTVTGATMLHLIQEQALADDPTLSGNALSDAVDLVLTTTTIDDVLPDNWTIGAGFETVTLAQLLTHSGGITGYRLGYNSLRTLVARNDIIQDPDGDGDYDEHKSYSYLTTNFSLMRVILPYLWDEIPNDVLNANSTNNLLFLNTLPSDVSDFVVADWNLIPNPILNIVSITPDQLTASIYKYYVSEYILGPAAAGIASPDTRPPAGNDYTLLYQFPAPFLTPGVDTTDPTVSSGGDQTLFAGARGWNISARDLDDFLSAIRYDDGILDPAVRQLMNDMDYGWKNGGVTGILGNYEHHDGINFRPAPGQPPMNNTQVMVFPGGVQAATLFNSQLGPQFGTAFSETNAAQSTIGALRDAYDNAWTHVVYEGDGGAGTAADDSFVLRTVAGTTNWIELRHDSTTVMQRRIDTIEFLQIDGLGGDDTLTIQSLPDNFAFEIVFNGAGGDDTLNINTTSDGGLLAVTFNGGSGDDTAATSGLIVGSTIDFSFNGGSGDDVATIDDLPSGGAFTFNGAAGNDQVNVVGTVPGSIVTLHGGDNDDTVILGTSGNLDHVRSTFLFVGGAGSDFLHVDDRNNTGFEPLPHGYDQQYIVRQSRIERSGIGVVGQFSQLENITLDASHEKSLIRVLSTTSFTDLQLNANKGGDRIVLGSGNASTQINSLIRVHAADGNDTLIIDDRNSQIEDEKYIFQREFFQASSILLVHWGDASPPESIRLRQSQVGTETNIRDLLSGVRLDVEGNAGDDHIYVHKTEAGSMLYVGGGERDDTIVLGQESQDVDPIQGVVFAYGGSGTDVVVVQDAANSDGNGRNYRVVGRTVDVIGSPFGKLIVPSTAGMETVEIRGGVENDLFDVRTWLQTAALHVHGNSGDDELRVAATTHTLNSIVGDLEFYADPNPSPGTPSPDFDTVILHDDQRVGSPDYDIDVGPDLEAAVVTNGFDFTHFGVEELTLNANDTGNDVDVFGLSSILHKADYILNVGGGKDTIDVQAPVSATVYANGGTGNDRLTIYGTGGDDEATVQGDRVDLGPVGLVPTTTVVRDSGILLMRVDSEAGNDVLIVQGQAGLQESILVASNGFVAGGRLIASPFRRVDFSDTEDVDVRGNAGDDDSLKFAGTDNADNFSINPVGAGTTFQPFVQLTQSGGINLLKLRDATQVGIPVIRGLEGSDTFRVTMFPGGPGYPVRDMRLEAGEDAGGADLDQLIVNYDDTIFNVVSPATNPNNGTVRFDDGTDILSMIFRDFENVVGDIF